MLSAKLVSDPIKTPFSSHPFSSYVMATTTTRLPYALAEPEMKFVSQVHAPSFNLSAPSNPTCSGVDSTSPFYSAPSSPSSQFSRELDTTKKRNDDMFEFEFETSRRFTNGYVFEFESSPTSDNRQPAQAQSCNTMTFADQLFSNGQVLPLKLPPRLQYGRDTDCASQRSVPTSPRSPGSTLRFSFAKHSTWNDNFDPFAVALEKVSEETRGRNSVHRRSRSHSPFRTTTLEENSPGRWNHDHQPKQLSGDLLGPVQQLRPNLERKGSMYSRWVRSQEVGRTRKRSPSVSGRSLTTGLWFGRKGRSSKVDQEASVEPSLMTPIEPAMKQSEASKMQKVKGILLRYASFGRESTGDSETPTMGKLSFRLKSSGKKKVCEEPKMAVVKFSSPKLPLCLGHAPTSPKRMT